MNGKQSSRWQCLIEPVRVSAMWWQIGFGKPPKVAAVALGFLVLADWSTPVNAESGTPSLRNARALRCEFRQGVEVVWTANEPHPAAADFGPAGVITFYAIDRKKGSARILANQGTGSVALIAKPTGLNFVETTDSGNLVFTTVFVGATDDGKFKAVTSRHLLFPTGPLPSQFYGLCAPVDL